MHEAKLGCELPSVMALAFLGDARHSLFIRDRLVRRGISSSAELNREAQRYVTAEAQAEAFRRISLLLTEDENAVARRARNHSHLNKPKHATGGEYRAATAFEAVIGMLVYLGDEERITELLSLSLAVESDEDREAGE